MAEVNAPASRESGLGFVTKFLQRREIGAILAVGVLFLIGSLIRPDVFLSGGNMLGIIRNTAVVSIIGYGMTLLMVSGEFDLSVGSLMAVSAALVATMYSDGYSIAFAIVLVLLLAAVYGMFQGLMVTKLGLPSLIVTIGTLTLLRGLNLVILGGQTQSVSNADYPELLFYLGGVLEFGNIPSTVSQFPMQIIWTFGFLGLGYYVLNKTAFGYRAMFTGGNQESAQRTGIKTHHVKIISFMLVALLAAFAGISQFAFTQAVSTSTGQGVELIVIASVVIGGTNLFGGEGSMPGTFLGALVFALTQNILVLAGLGVRLFQIFTGIFIIVAVLIEVLSREVRIEYFTDYYVSPLQSVVSETGSFFKYVKSDIQGIDQPLIFAAVGTIMWSVAALVLMTIVEATIGWQFSLFIVKPGVAAIGIVPVLGFMLTAVVILFTTIFTHGTAKALGTRRDFDTSLQGVIYSSAPTVFLFLPILLAGWEFITPIVLAASLIVIVPSVYLLYQATQILHDFTPRNAAISVTSMAILWLLVAAYVTMQLSV